MRNADMSSLLAGSQSPHLEVVARNLFDDVPEETVVQYGSGFWSALARDNLEFIGRRQPGVPKIRVRRIDGPTASSLVEVLNDDMPFLVDSVLGEIRQRGLNVSLVLHPIFISKRSAGGDLEEIAATSENGTTSGARESFIQILVDPLADADAAALERALGEVLGDVRLAVTDWKPMLARLDQAIGTLKASPPPVSEVDQREVVAFLEWIAVGNFTLLGMSELAIVETDGSIRLEARQDKRLGVLRNPDVRVLRRAGDPIGMTPKIREFYLQPAPLIVAKANALSRVHRRTNMDYIGLKSFAAGGAVTGELRIAGLFTSGAYTQSVRDIPLLRQKVDRVIASSPHAPNSHSGKALMNILETFPRDELFQIGLKNLSDWSLAIVDLELRPRPRAFARLDDFDRFASILTYVPRERYSTKLVTDIGAFLANSYGGELASAQPYYAEGPLVRTQYIVQRDTGAAKSVTAGELEDGLRDLVTNWQDRFVAEARTASAVDFAVARRYQSAFSAGYRETFSPARALEDVRRLECLGDATPVAVDFYRDASAAPTEVRAALYRLDSPIPLSERVPVFENFGFKVIDERSYRLKPLIAGAPRQVLLHDMVLQRRSTDADDLMQHDVRLEDCFLAIGRGDAEDDLFNSLILAAGFDWRQAMLMRAYAAFMRQARSPHGPRYVAETLVAHADVAGDLYALFAARHDPDAADQTIADRRNTSDGIRQRIEAALAKTTSLDEDRILRTLLNLMLATLRTNFFSRDADGKPVDPLGLKLDSQVIEGLPKPKPLVEIWVYSPRVEGIHLRFARIARGGLRWSDRAQDFRTEVLGLVKAQQVKNAVIVPSGAKGGFLPKRLPKGGTREAVMAEGTAAYDLFVGTLLALTDNIDGDKVVPPAGIIRQDGDDPYLVVAADKGTATFSDRANGLAAAHGFWLGDAFASGGSVGYDHKKMGITARGGWESVKRHFREMNVDIQATPFRAIGVGDMSGDVFGNAMLLSLQTLLVAAFDHRDIFIDPNPDAGKSFAERKRMFALPRSSWQDYDKSLISQGGGIFSRSAKAIPLSAEMRQMLGVTAAEMAPNDLMNALLKASADLLWFGGIGTYVRASDETDDQVGDRANDAIRVSAQELGAKVIGEGANLGMTQRGRIEFGKRGGRLNTDFIDNSAGVNSSDQEVNIKIALRPVVAAGKLPMSERNSLLASMTDQVAAAVLRNNYLQSLALSLVSHRGLAEMPAQGRLMTELTATVGLDRRIEFLPTDAELAERRKAGQPLTRPELAVLLSWAKIDLYARLLASDVPDDADLASLLVRYFPQTLRVAYPQAINQHRLRREIIATGLANDMVNRGGATMSSSLAEETGRPLAQIARAFVAATAVFELDQLWPRIDALDDKIDGGVQLELYSAVEELVRRQTGWFARRADFSKGLAPAIAAYRGGITDYARSLQSNLSATERARLAADEQRYATAGVPPSLAIAIASLGPLGESTDVVETALASGSEVVAVSSVHAAVGAEFRFDELIERSSRLPAADRYDRQAINGLREVIDQAHKSLTRNALAGGGDVATWLAARGDKGPAIRAALADILDGGQMSVARLTVAAQLSRDLAAG